MTTQTRRSTRLLDRFHDGVRSVFQVRTPSRRVGAFATLALIAVAALPTVTASGAFFTDEASTTGNTAASATLEPVTSLTATAAGSGSTVAWSSATALPWATANNVTSGVGYTLQRTTATTGTQTIYTGTGTATTDPGTPVARGGSPITTGAAHSCALSTSGVASCWGQNTNGQLGNGTTTSSTTPAAVTASGVLAGKVLIGIAAGDTHTCAVDNTGAAYCWGAGGSGQLGNGTTANSTVPVRVTATGALAGKVLTSISAGTNYTCALDSAGASYCWGVNGIGQIGNGTSTNATTAVAVTTSGALAGKRLTSITAGNSHACALDSAGAVYCWGDNSSGQLGNTSTTNATTPVAVTNTGVLSGKTVTAVAAGRASTCAVDTTGAAFCWGDNGLGQLGNATNQMSTSPVAVTTAGVLSGKSLTAIAIGSQHVCALDTAGAAYCWGDNSDGQFGNGTTTGSSTPTSVTMTGTLSGKRLTSIDAGTNYTCVADSAGASYCWGYNASSQVGDGTTVTRVTPTAPVQGFVTVSVGAQGNATCALNAAGAAYCWGLNGAGQLGNGTTTASSTPVPVSTAGVLAGKTLTSISVGAGHACAVDSDGLAYCWGNNASFQLGNGNTNKTTPVQVIGLTGLRITAIAAGVSHTCAVTDTGRAYCWGNNSNYNLGTGSIYGTVDTPTPVRTTGVLAGKTLTAIAAGNQSTCALDSASILYCWGLNTSGQLGIGSSVSQAEPVVVNNGGVLNGKVLTSITLGGAHTCATDSTGRAYCWGQAASGQLGNGSVNDSTSPVAVSTSGVLAGKVLTSIAAGNGHTCAVDTAGLAYCWGLQTSGQLGGSGSANSAIPVTVNSGGALAGKKLVAIDAGAAHTCAVDNLGAVFCWGLNSSGQLGNGTSTTSTTAASVPSTTTLVVAQPANYCSGAATAAAYCPLTGTVTYTLTYDYQTWVSVAKTANRT